MIHCLYCDRDLETIDYDNELRKESIREVVEWLRSMGFGYGKRGEYIWAYINAPDWQAKLREWGIEVNK